MNETDWFMRILFNAQDTVSWTNTQYHANLGTDILPGFSKKHEAILMCPCREFVERISIVYSLDPGISRNISLSGRLWTN